MRGGVFVRLGGRWQLQRSPCNPTCFAPSCTTHSALARALLAPCLRECFVGLRALAWAPRVSVRLGGGWHLQRRLGNPTSFAPSCATHSALARALLASCLRGCCGELRVLFGRAQGLAVLGCNLHPSQPYLFSPSYAAHSVLVCARLASFFAWFFGEARGFCAGEG